ncbi:MAG: Gfo/Idh/MocA family oxidoreductase [Dehalococcoidia bacterium]
MTTTSFAVPQRRRNAGETLGVAVVGCGYWGPNLIRNFFDTPGCRVASVCDMSAPRLEAVRKRHPSVQVTTRFDEVLADPTVDAVAIATPVHTHADLAKRALLAGKHVLVEKPMTTTSAEAEQLVEIADRRGLVLMVDHTFVYTGAIRRIKQMVDSGEIGRLYYYDSVRVNLGLVQHDVSVIWDLAAHDFSIMDYVLGARPRAVSAVGATHLPGGLADVAYLTVHFDGNLIAHFHVNWLSPVKVRQVLIGGDRRMVLYDDIQATEKIKVYDRGVHWNDDPNEARREALVAYRSGDMYAPVLDQTEALRTECAHFVDSILTGATPATDGVAGLRVVKLLEAAERSLARQGAMECVDL